MRLFRRSRREPAAATTREDTFDLTVFEQGGFWVSRAGDSSTIASMTADERHELRAWLQEHHRYFYLHVLTRELYSVWPTTMVRLPDRAPDLLFSSAMEWLENTPLYRALSQ